MDIIVAVCELHCAGRGVASVGAAVHGDHGSVCPVTTGGAGVPPLAVHTPRTLPAPPKTMGCYEGTANGWRAVTCSPASSLSSFVLLPSQIDIETPNKTSPTTPFQFGQLETTFTAYASETDSKAGGNHISVQGNTNYFKDNKWVQFAVGSDGAQSSVFIQTWDVNKYDACKNAGTTIACDDGVCGCNNYGVGKNPLVVANRAGGLKPFDFVTVAGSTYTDDKGAAALGLVAQFSWFDPGNDPDNHRGLYAIVAPDAYGLAGNWLQFSGDVLGYGSSSQANFSNSSLLSRTLVGSCANGVPPASGIPWPGDCPGTSALLPDTLVSTATPTGETNNLCLVGSPSTLSAANSNLVFTEFLEAESATFSSSTSCASAACIATSSPIFVKSTNEDTGARPINIGTQPFWESPDLFVVPSGEVPDVNGLSTETLVTPNTNFDVWVRVNNDFGCNSVDGAKALVYISDPGALSLPLVPITSGQYLGSTNGSNPNGVSVPAGKRALIGPFTFQSSRTGHLCLLAAIQANGEGGPMSTTDPLASYQVAQRNLQFSDCQVPLTNATLTNGFVTLRLSSTGATPTLSGAEQLSLTLSDPGHVWFDKWSVGAGVGTAYSVSQANGLTTVTLGQTSVTLDQVPLAAGQTATGTANVTVGTGDPETTLQVGATLIDSTGKVLVANGVSCVGTALTVPR